MKRGKARARRIRRTTIPARIFAQNGKEINFVDAEEFVAMLKLSFSGMRIADFTSDSA
jgi:hypothetical protein